MKAALRPSQAQRFSRRPPATENVPRTVSADPQPASSASHAPLLLPPTNSFPRSTQVFSSTHFCTARKWGISGPFLQSATFAMLGEQRMAPSAKQLNGSETTCCNPTLIATASPGTSNPEPWIGGTAAVPQPE